MTEQFAKQQPLKVQPRAKILAKLHALHERLINGAVAPTTTVATQDLAALEIGEVAADGTIYAGLTADGKQDIYAMPTDLDVTLTFNDAAKRVKSLNADKALGHDDWQIPSVENLRVLQKNQNEGALKGTFNTTNKGSGSNFPHWYWSSTEDHYYPADVHHVRFSDGDEGWDHKGSLRLSSRPVRLVATSSAPRPGEAFALRSKTCG